MAKIKGIQLKAVNYFRGHDGYGVSANLYLDNKKIGEILDDGWGGGFQIHIEQKEKEEILKERVKRYFDENPSEFPEVEIFLDDLLNLSNLEKDWKKMVKDGLPILVDMHFRKIGTVPVGATKKPVCMGVNNEATLQKVLLEYKPVDHRVYRSEKDFIIE